MHNKKTLNSLETVSQKLKMDGLTWLDFTKAVPFHYTKINEFKSWAYFLRTISSWILFLYLGQRLHQLAAWGPWEYAGSALISFLVLLCYMNLFTVGHECGHFIFSRFKWANYIVGQFIFGIVYIGLQNWKISHNFHHVHTQHLKNDTTWTKDKCTVEQFNSGTSKFKKEYLVGYASYVGILIGYYFAVVQYFFFEKNHPFISLVKKQKKQILVSNIMMLFVAVLHFGIAYYVGGFAYYFNYHLLPLMVGAIFVVGVPLLQHSHEHAVYFDKSNWTPLRGQILGTYNFRIPYFWERVLNDVNLHIVHHISPKVPWYNLRPAYEELKRKYPDYVLEYDLTWDTLRKIYQKPLVEWDRENDFYKTAEIKS